MSNIQVIKENIYQGIGAPLLGGTKYNLILDKTTGDWSIVEQNILGPTQLPFTGPLFKNGEFYSAAIQNPDLFENGDPNKPTEKLKNLYTESKNLIIRSRNSNRTIPEHPSLKEQNYKVQSFSSPGQSPNDNIFFKPLTDAFPGLADLFKPPGQGNTFDNPRLEDYGTNMKALFNGEKVLAYPMDIISGQNEDAAQDVLVITQYTYKPPYNDVFENANNINSIANLNGVQRTSAIKDYIGKVILPIPNNVADSNLVDWGNGEGMNTVAMTAAGDMRTASAVAAAVKGGELINLPDQFKSILSNGPLLYSLFSRNVINPTTRKAFESEILKMIGFNIPAETLLSRGYGVISNSNLELLFSGPSLRGFDFQYSLTPRSEEEALRCRKILRFFKQGMAAKKKNTLSTGNNSPNTSSGYGSASYLLGTPNIFKLEYKTWDSNSRKLELIEGLNRFKICALTNMSTSYSDGMWSAYEKGQPAKMQINLAFKELEPVYENDYQDSPSDLYKTLSTNKKDTDISPVRFNGDIVDIGY